MEITKLTVQVKNPDRINVFLDNKYAFSLDITQIIDLAVKIGNKYDDEQILQLKREGEFSKYYNKALAYSLTRPRSIGEINDYLYKQTRTKTYLAKGECKEKAGMSANLSQRIIDRLIEKGYLDNERFAKYWVENRNLKKGISERVLRQELAKKGINNETIQRTISESNRSDKYELKKVIAKRRHRYTDDKKFIKYLMSKGYQYSMIQETLSELAFSEEAGS